MQQGIKTGLIAFAVMTYLILVGLPQRIGELAFPILSMVAALLFYLLLRKSSQKRAANQVLSTGVVAGVTTGVLMVALIALFTTLLGTGVRLQPIFDKIVPLNMAALHSVSAGTIASGSVQLMAYLRQLLMMIGSGIAGVLLILASRSGSVHSLRRVQLPGGHWILLILPFVLFGIVYLLGQSGMRFFGTNQGTVRLLIAMIAIGSCLFALRHARPGREQVIVSILLAVLMLLLPLTLDRFQNSVLGIVFIFVMMGLGLNVVVGYAGLLDLGYVAFFAIGAYIYAFLAAPASSPYISQLLLSLGISPQSPLLSYWMAIPVAMLTAAIGGVLLGIPVLRLRGDYLAIVTLGFGEIIRLFMLNLSNLTNGPRGLLNIAPPTLGGTSMGNPMGIFYLALLGSALIAFVAYRLNDSRLGRAWVAMREDEDVAQATGINLVRTKLLAFSIGATFAGLAGQLYAARQVNIFPENFSLFVSIDALALIIVGGMGSIPGVVLGALALKGLPEVLRGVDEYRIVAFAALLVIMMIVRPEGILPSSRRQRELAAESAVEGPPIETDLTVSSEAVTGSQQPQGGRA
jgi:branched-chain amino acid transport system permease protein